MEKLINPGFHSLIIDGERLDREALLTRCVKTESDGKSTAFEKELYRFIKRWLDSSSVIEIETSGTTGNPKVIPVEKSRMIAGAGLTGKVLNLQPGEAALLCLPVTFIAGMMMVVRAFVLGLNLVPRKPAANPGPYLNRRYGFAAMTPMQVWEILQEEKGDEKLEQVDKLIIGGGSVSPILEKRLGLLGNRIWHTYGMTETLTHIAIRKINGDGVSRWFTPLPGITVNRKENGVLEILAPAVCVSPVTTEDIAELDGTGRFRIIGRKDNVINTGGLKVSPEPVEQLFSGMIPYPFFAAGWPDEQLGQKIVLFIENRKPDQQLVSKLAAFKKNADNRKTFPRAVCFIPGIFRTSAGKFKRKETVEYYISHPGKIIWQKL